MEPDSPRVMDPIRLTDFKVTHNMHGADRTKSTGDKKCQWLVDRTPTCVKSQRTMSIIKVLNKCLLWKISRYQIEYLKDFKYAENLSNWLVALWDLTVMQLYLNFRGNGLSCFSSAGNKLSANILFLKNKTIKKNKKKYICQYRNPSHYTKIEIIHNWCTILIDN